MTDVINGRSVTDGGDVRVGVRVPEMPLNGARRGGSVLGSAHARAIPDNGDVRQDATRSKARNFASQHGGEAKQAFVASWPLNDRPSTLRELAARVIPGRAVWSKGKTRWLAKFVIGTFRLAFCTVLWLAALAVDSDIRAAVVLALLVLTTATMCIAGALPH
jgi:hypothetical protein